MTDSIILVGGGGHCKACIDVIETTEFSIGGILDKEAMGSVLGFNVIGTDDDLKSLIEKGHRFLITVGQVKTAEIRKQLYDKIKTSGGTLATIVATSAQVSKYSTAGEGTIIMHHALVNAAVKIGKNCIINNKALIEHDCVVGDHTHISTAAVINGGCKIGHSVFVGSNTVIVQGVEVGDGVVIGAGSGVRKDIMEPGIYAGNPARRIQ
jgi:sugar O-acyltransferase (sialic acid O-acetyltransferase NeuD family)